MTFCMRVTAAAVACGSPREVVYWMPAQTREAIITSPAPSDRKRMMAKVASRIALPLCTQPMSKLISIVSPGPPHELLVLGLPKLYVAPPGALVGLQAAGVPPAAATKVVPVAQSACDVGGAAARAEPPNTKVKLSSVTITSNRNVGLVSIVFVWKVMALSAQFNYLQVWNAVMKKARGPTRTSRQPQRGQSN